MIKRKQRFSLRKNKIGTASVLLGLTIVGGASYAGTEIQAADVPKEETKVKEDKVYTVTDEQVLGLEKKVDGKKLEIEKSNKEVEDNKIFITNVQKEQETLNNKNALLTKKIEEAKKITPVVIGGVKTDILEAEKAKFIKENELEQAKKDEAKKLNKKDDIDKKVQFAQKEADEGDKDVDAKKRAFDPQEIVKAREQLKDVEKLVDEKQSTKDAARKELNQAIEYDKKLEQSKEAAKADLNTKKEEKVTKTGELEDVKRRKVDEESALEKAKNPFGVKGINMTVSLDPRFVVGLKEYFELDSREAREAKMKELIKIEKEVLSKVNFKRSTDDEYKNDEKIDIRNISLEDNLIYSQYFTMLNNQIREQFGKVAQKVNLNTQKFIREAEKITMDDNYSESMHYHRALNKAAYKFGIDKVDKGELYNRFESQDYTFVRKSDNKHVSKRFLFNALHDSLLRFYYEAHMTEDYGHAEHMLDDSETRAVGFAVTSDLTGKSMNLDQLKISIASVHKYVHKNREEWKRDYSLESKDNLEPIHISTEAEIREKEKNLVKVTKATEDAKKAFDIATKNEADAQAKVDELNKIKEKTSDAQKKLEAANKELTKVESEKIKAEENLKNVTSNQDVKEKALDAAIAIQRQKHDVLNNVKSDLNGVQEEYANAVKTRENKEQSLQDIKDSIAALNDKKKDFEERLTKLAEDEKELVKVKAQLKDIDDELTELLQIQVKLNDKLEKYKSDLKELEKEYNRLLEIYTKEHKPEADQFDPEVDKPFLDIKEEVKGAELDYKTVEQADPTLEDGKRVVKVNGKKGRKLIKIITLLEKGKVLDVVTQENVIEEVVDEVVLVGVKRPDVPIDSGKEQTSGEDQNLGEKKEPGKDQDKAPEIIGDEILAVPEDKFPEITGYKAHGELNRKQELQRPRVNSNGLNTLPNTGESQTGIATAAGLVALAVAARLRKKDKQN